MKTFKIILGILFVAGLAKGQDIQKGIWLFKQKQYYSAKRTFQTCLELNPADAKAMYYFGKVYYSLDKIDSADFFFQKGLTANPAEPLNYLGAGLMQLNKSNRGDWVKLYDKGHRLSSDIFAYNIEAADVCLSAKTKHYDFVASCLEEARAKQSKNPNLYIRYGDFYFVSKTPGDAANEYERAIYYDKNCVEALLKVGEIYARASNYKDGLNAYNFAITADSSQVLGYKLRGDLFYNFAKYAEAKKDYDIYMQRSDKTLEDQQKYIFILFFSKEYERAGTLITSMLEANPELTILYRISAYIDFETGNFEPGLKNIITFFQSHDTTKFIALDYAYYGRLLIKNNQDSLGTVQLEKAIQMDSTKVEIYEEIAKSYSRMKDFGKSIEAYNMMLIVNPVNLQNIYYQVGRNYYFLAEDTLSVADSNQQTVFYMKADSNFMKVTELNPESYIGFIWRGRTHSRLDPETSMGLAKPYYEQAAALLEMGDPAKTPKLLIECYRYLAFYYYLLADNTTSSDHEVSRTAMSDSINYWNKVLALDPNDNQAKTALENLKVE